ncbi:MAG: methylenetetrahydrofolate reductase [Bacteroidales bacterium]|jgi:methylenetetrahydrofolate reductase (NADPH)|nr:methylenetetrahydrofolate reductase [Bacteroidales bacterium]
MKVIDILNTPNTKFTFEIVPPMKGSTLDDISQTIETLLPYNPSYINVTSHRAETVMVENSNGSFTKKVVTKRPGTVGVAASIKFKYGVEVVPHLICGGFSAEETEDALFDLQFLGIQNVLALRGDATKGERAFTPEPNGHANADALVTQIAKMNHGEFYTPELKNAGATNFCIGAAGYPEKHCEAPNMETDLRHLKSKINAGAEYIVTQMFFDNQKYFQFVEDCRKIGITAPIVPGIKPISLLANLNNLPQIFHIDLPSDLAREVEKCKTNAEVRDLGVEWAIQQCKELKAAGVPALHFFTLGSTAKNIAEIVKTVY